MQQMLDSERSEQIHVLCSPMGIEWCRQYPHLGQKILRKWLSSEVEGSAGKLNFSLISVVFFIDAALFNRDFIGRLFSSFSIACEEKAEWSHGFADSVAWRENCEETVEQFSIVCVYSLTGKHKVK